MNKHEHPIPCGLREFNINGKGLNYALVDLQFGLQGFWQHTTLAQTRLYDLEIGDFMKNKFKVFVLVGLILALVGGCAQMEKIQTVLGTILGTVQQAVCAPTPEQKETADEVKSAIANGVVFGVPLVVKISTGATVTVTPEQVTAIMDEIQRGICVGLDDLEAALTWFGEMVPKTKAAKAIPGAKALLATPDTGPLWSMVVKAKKAGK